MQLIQALLKKYWTGNITAEERSLLMSLLKEKDHQHIDDYAHELNSFNDDRSEISAIPDAEELLQRIHLKIQLQEEKDKKKIPVIRILFNKLKWVAAAMIFFFFAKHLIEGRTAGTNKLISATEAGVKEKNAIHVIANTTTGVQHVQLKDSSVVMLHPESDLSFSDSFNIVSRVITLRGKAFFKVAKNAEKPFSVQLDDVVTTALGTHFMVDGKEENNIRVRLLEGKVVIRNVKKESMRPVYLLPGQVCTIEPHKMKAVVKQWKQKAVQSPVVVKRTSGNARQQKPSPLEFERTPLHDVFKTIEKVYNITIDYTAAEEKKQASFTGNFSPTVSPELLITIICKTNDLSFEKRENVYFISNLK